MSSFPVCTSTPSLNFLDAFANDTSTVRGVYSADVIGVVGFSGSASTIGASSGTVALFCP